MEFGGHNSLCWVNYSGETKNTQHKNLLVIIIPGLTGCIEDSYIKEISGNLCKEGYKCVVYHSRFNGIKMQLPEEGFLDVVKDFKATVDYLAKKDKNLKFFGVGHSAGANLLVNYLGMHPENNNFIGAVSLANPYNLMLTINKLKDTFVDKVMSGLLKTVTDKSKKEISEAARFKINVDQLSELETVREFDDKFTIKVFGFESVDDYYWNISSCRRVKNTKIPLFILNSIDDPLCAENAFHKREIEKDCPNVILMITQSGGHLGWIEGVFSLKRWYIKPTMEFVNAVVENADMSF